MEYPTILISSAFEYIYYGIYFCLAVFLSFTIPGSFLSKYFRLKPLPNLVVATVLGMIIWVWLATISGLVGFGNLTLIFVILTTLLWLATKGYRLLPKLRDCWQLKKYTFYIIVGTCGIIALMTPLIINGVTTSNGVLFCCTSDTFWYLSLTQEIIKNYPPQTPGLTGVPLTNYHFFYNTTIAEIVRVFGLPLAPTIFQFSRFLFVLLYAATGLLLIRKITKNTLAHKLFYVFLFFGSDFGHVVGLLLSGKIELNYTSIYLSQMAFFNMPMGVATILLFTYLYLLLVSQKNSKVIQYLIIGILSGTILGYKTHMGMIVVFGICIYAITESISRKTFKPLILLVSSTLTAALIFLPTNSGSGGLYPTWFFQIEQGMKNPLFRFNQQKLESIAYLTKKGRMLTLPIPKIIEILSYELYFASVYIFGFFGTTLLGIFQLKKIIAGKAYHFMIIGMTLLATILGMFFHQTTGVGHTYNFLIVAYIFGLIYASITMGNWLTKRKFRLFAIPAIVLLILANLARSHSSLINYTNTIANENIFILTSAELEGLEFLSRQADTSSYVLVDPANFLNYITPYISVFINHPLYYSGEYIVSALNLNYQDRKNVANTIKNSTDATLVRELMNKEKIGYIYVKKPDKWETSRGGTRVFEIVFSNEELNIYKAFNNR